MSTERATAPSHRPVKSGWSNRVLLLALAGILFLTFYPFRFSARAQSLDHLSPFFLAGIWKGGGPYDVVLNISLFVPLGFGISEKLRDRGWSREKMFFATWVGGFLVSYTIEFLQQYTPTRQSRWEDVCTNSMGAIAGFALFQLCGSFLVRWALAAERVLRASLTLRRAALLLPIYFAVWFGISVALQRETRLTNWDRDSDNGSSARLYVDGTKYRDVYDLGPGTGLAKIVGRTKPSELEGYAYIYDALIFFPAGVLFGIAAMSFGPRDLPTYLLILLAVEVLLPPWFLDRILSHISGRPMSARSELLCLILFVAGGFWINGDRERAPLRQDPAPGGSN
jgi:glycopeptide antibiotics resistance protein